jgi:hypothetical protein
MKENSIVECIVGHPGVIQENNYYTVKQVFEKGITLYEVDPPPPYNCFLKERFIEVQSPDEIEVIFSEIILDHV